MKKFLILLALAGLFVACTDNPDEPTGDVTLDLSLNSTAYASGGSIVATITDVSGSDVTRGDINLIFYVINLDTNTYDYSMFKSFTESAVLKAGETSIQVENPLLDDIEDTYTLRFVAAAAGCAINGDQPKITVAPGFVVTLSVTGNSEGIVTEGESFTLTATTEVAPSEDVTINLSYSDSAAVYFDPLPTTMVIPSGKKTGVSDEITVTEDSGIYQFEQYFEISGTSSSKTYIVSPFTITRADKDSQYGSYLSDERWVYEDPDQAFYSSSTESLYLECPSYKEGDVLMEKFNYTTLTDGSPHPNATLAAEGWTLLNAAEFHAIDGDNYSRTAINSYGVHRINVANGWGEQNTAGVEKISFVSNEKFSDVTDDGYLRLWTGNYAAGQAASSASGTRYVGAGSAFGCKNMPGGVFKAQTTWLAEGTRIEIRARLRGDRQGTLMALWMQGNDAQIADEDSKKVWPQYGEIDILENHVVKGEESDASAWNKVEQTIHWGYEDSNSTPTHNNPTIVNSVDDIEEWNIYWVEIHNGSIVMGVNGQTTRTFTKDDTTNNHGDYDWPFSNEYNPGGYHILLTCYAGYPNYTVGDTSWMTDDLKGLSYEDSITSDTAPRIEIDWIRYWKNDEYNYTYNTSGSNSWTNYGINSAVNLF
ncbi:MAG: DUF5006 domain-containing protein [Bacteroidales bacterium]|nr:DUF5006 domain-containing protein [Bacteroidales bacterium]